MTELEDKVKKLTNLINIQESTGNWDYSPYMFGLLNGMLLARSIMETSPDDADSDPFYKEAPETWIEDLDILEKLNKSGIVINPDIGEKK